MPHRPVHRFAVHAAVAFLLAGCVFAIAYHYDNKYLFGPPYGSDGVIEVSDDDLDRLVPLVDGWMLSVDGAPRTETFIGQYSNFSYAPGGTSAFGSAVYELTLSYVGAQRERALVLLVPEVYGDFTLYVNGVVAAAGGDGAQVGIVADRDTRLRLEVRNDEHYYSGLVYPPVLGTAQQMANVSFANALSACVLVLGPLAAALFAFAVRRKRDGDALARDFGVLCAAFAVAGAHGLVWHLGAAGAWWYAVEDAAWTCVLVSAVSVAARAAGSAWTRDARPLVRRTARALWALPVVTLAWALSIPALPGGIEAYGLYQTAVRVGCWALFAVCAAVGLRDRTDEARFVLCGCAVLGAALVANLLDNNAYEPMYGLWQSEYAGLLLVGVFAWMLVERVRRLRLAAEQVRDLEVQVRAAEAGLRHLRSGEEATRAARHDLRHHAAALSRLIDAGEQERCRAYLVELSGQQEAEAPLRYADNLVANAVMAAYLAPAQAAGIEVRCEARVPAELPLRDTELSVLLSNLLSNAVEACEPRAPAGLSSRFPCARRTDGWPCDARTRPSPARRSRARPRPTRPATVWACPPCARSSNATAARSTPTSRAESPSCASSFAWTAERRIIGRKTRFPADFRVFRPMMRMCSQGFGSRRARGARRGAENVVNLRAAW